MLRRRYGREAAEDLAQETYLKLARAGSAMDVRNPRALLAHIARNAATDHFRRARRDGSSGARDGELERAPVAANQDQATLVKQIVLALPPKLRDVFVLNQVEGLTHPEIAHLLGLSVKTVEWRMKKALALCVQALRD
jgi:RNA polymerase sigma-70 factor (ECF subfamily)